MNTGSSGLTHPRLGTRGSALATEQAHRVRNRLRDLAPDLDIETVIVRTEGDTDKTSPLTVIGGRGVFTSGLQAALRRGTIDAAVHSAKDLPSEPAPDLLLVAFPEREDPRDVLVSRHGVPLAALPPRPRVGTSSRRRATQIRQVRPDACIADLRGNVDTRLRKALTTDLDAIVLAAAGVRRMGWEDAITEDLSLDAFVPAPGQGALAIEIRAADEPVRSLLARLDDGAVSAAVRAERAFLRAIGGGCTSPLGAHVSVESGTPWLRAMLASDDGSRVLWAHEALDPARLEATAAAIGRDLLARLEASDRAVHRRPGKEIAANGKPAAAGHAAPLAGRTVVVTRAREQAAELADLLRAHGAEPVLLPTIRVAPPLDPAPLDDALTRWVAGGFDWIVFTSVNGVERVVDRLDGLGLDRAAPGRGAVAAVGSATAAALTGAGLPVDLVPDRFDADGIIAALAAHGLRDRRVLYPRGDLARPTLASGLRRLGARVETVDAYRTVAETAVDPSILEQLDRGEIDVVTFASASSVHNLVAMLGPAHAALATTTIACIGPVTADAARALGLPVDVLAERATMEGLVAALVRHATRDAPDEPVPPLASVASGRDV